MQNKQQLLQKASLSLEHCIGLNLKGSRNCLNFTSIWSLRHLNLRILKKRGIKWQGCRMARYFQNETMCSQILCIIYKLLLILVYLQAK